MDIAISISVPALIVLTICVAAVAAYRIGKR